MQRTSLLVALVCPALCALTACDNRFSITEQQALDQLGTQPPDTGPAAVSDAVGLGRLLFWDPILSGDRDVACATCHHPTFAYGDGVARSHGHGGAGLGPARAGGAVVDRNAPTVLNTRFAGFTANLGGEPPETAPLFWDARADGLEEQALGPLTTATEMRGDIPEADVASTLEARLAAIPAYRALFAAAFGDDAISLDRVVSAIADFERTLTALDSPFDRFVAGDQQALSDAARRGMRRFVEVGCARCHSGPVFSDFRTHGIGVVSRRADGTLDDGAGNGAFRTPPLRNVALTAPYMHDGSLATLRDVLQHYQQISGRGGNNGGGAGNGPFPIAQEARQLRLGRGDLDDIEAFLRALSSPGFDARIPSDVPSGLPPGGDIGGGGGGGVAQ
ncbi:MAG: cytochrome C peroxidase [Deltaproteobacteria bacterium]|nr:cytochrome C peroxidase [Deltaproteobacteria bacterium]